MTWTNKLYYGDCLSIMQGMALQSVDLIYLDPPFNSNREYNAIYKGGAGRPLPDQISASTLPFMRSSASPRYG